MSAMLFTAMAEGVWGLADPTRPPIFGEQAAKSTPFRLNSLLISDERKVAIVNGQSVSIGEMVNGARVVYIDNNKVKLNKNGEVIELVPKRVSIRQEK
ncbi:MAG: MSHA biogenesis protein MshK [Pseudohongiellaceae bacterium]|jgi:MSHA biogenesis protein MshK